ncbi:hypothetical protein AA0Z99_09835 [Agrococcus sp. 1P02AA]|uniref:hypothetical protein n=1 Tax=Agrococcus sp. 1P02AA TaxID=3132259 RepID=UPI0039A42668
MMGAERGGIEATTTEAGWIEIPEALEVDERQQWLEQSVGELRDAWGDAWDDRADLMVPTMLLESLEQRPDAHLVFEAWPFQVPARGRIRISMTESAALPDFAALGFSLIPYDGAAAGPGIMVVRQRDEHADDAEGVRVVDWGVVFDDGTRSLFVQVDTVPLFFFTRILAGLHGLVMSIRVTLPGGAPFVAQPSSSAMVDDESEWHALRLQAEGLLGQEES